MLLARRPSSSFSSLLQFHASLSVNIARSPDLNLLKISRAETMANETSNSDERQPLLSRPRSSETAIDNSTKEQHSAFYFNVIKFIIAIIGKWSATRRTSRLSGYMLRCLYRRLVLNIYRCLPRQRGYLPCGSNLLIHCFGV